MDGFRRKECTSRARDTFNHCPIGCRRQALINEGSLSEMVDVGLLKVALKGRVAAGLLQTDEPVRLCDGEAEENHEIFSGQPVEIVFEVPKPLEEFVALIGRDARCLMREI